VRVSLKAYHRITGQKMRKVESSIFIPSNKGLWMMRRIALTSDPCKLLNYFKFIA